MLRELLREIASGKVLTLRELAARFGLEEGTVRAMLEELERTGYLSSRSPECSLQCEGCPLKGSCGVAGVDRIWFLTAKGQKAIEEEKDG